MNLSIARKLRSVVCWISIALGLRYGRTIVVGLILCFGMWSESYAQQTPQGVNAVSAIVVLATPERAEVVSADSRVPASTAQLLMRQVDIFGREAIYTTRVSHHDGRTTIVEPVAGLITGPVEITLLSGDWLDRDEAELGNSFVGMHYGDLEPRFSLDNASSDAPLTDQLNSEFEKTNSVCESVIGIEQELEINVNIFSESLLLIRAESDGDQPSTVTQECDRVPSILEKLDDANSELQSAAATAREFGSQAINTLAVCKTPTDVQSADDHLKHSKTELIHTRKLLGTTQQFHDELNRIAKQANATADQLTASVDGSLQGEVDQVEHMVTTLPLLRHRLIGQIRECRTRLAAVSRSNSDSLPVSATVQAGWERINVAVTKIDTHDSVRDVGRAADDVIQPWLARQFKKQRLFDALQQCRRTAELDLDSSKVDAYLELIEQLHQTYASMEQIRNGCLQPQPTATPPTSSTATAPPSHRCRVTEWGEEICDEPGTAGPIDTAAIDEAIDLINTGRPGASVADDESDTGISLERPEADATWTHDDPRNPAGPTIVMRPRWPREPGLAEEFGSAPELPGESAQHTPHRPQRPHRPSHTGTHHEPGTASGTPEESGSPSASGTGSEGVPQADSDEAPDDSSMTDTGSGTDSDPPDQQQAPEVGTFHVIKESGTGLRKKWAGSANRISGFETSFIIKIDPATTEPSKHYYYWSYPASFNLAIEAEKWWTKARQSALNWCKSQEAALCPCPAKPGFWTDGPHYEFYAGPFEDLEAARAARGDSSKTNNTPGSIYQWVYENVSYTDVANACTTIQSGTTASSSTSTSPIPSAASVPSTPPETDTSVDGDNSSELHPCSRDSSSVAIAKWRFYQQFMGGGRSSYEEKSDLICYGSNAYYTYKGDSMQKYACDSGWQNCMAVAGKISIYTSIDTKDNGEAYYYYKGGYGRRSPY